jgi:CarD family transcriptional regulator
MMFNVNDTVLYGTHGICKIEEISTRNLTGNPAQYIVLKPVSDLKSTIFVPFDNEMLISKMRTLISEEEVDELINKMPEQDSVWVEDERERWEKFRGMLLSSDRVDIIKLIRTLYRQKLEQKSRSRRLNSIDERILGDAEKILHEEFGYILNIRPERVAAYIREKVEKTTTRETAILSARPRVI